MTVLVTDVNSDSQSAYLTLEIYTEQKEELDGKILIVMLFVFAFVLLVIVLGVAKNLKRKK